MAVMSVTVLTVKPGRYEDFLKEQEKSDALLKKAGAKNLRLVAALSAGEASGSVVAAFEADDWTAYGKVVDAFFASGGDAVMNDISAEDSPIARWQSSIYVDIPR